MVDIDTFPRGDVVTADPETTAADLASRMAEEGVGSIVIVDDGRPTGIVTDRDLTLEVLAAEEDPSSVTAADVGSEDVVTVEESAGIFDVLSRMEESEVRRVPAVDEDGQVTALVTYDDFVALFGREVGKLGRVAEAESPSY